MSIPTEIYADDTTLHHEHSKLPSCSTYPALQEAIDCTEEWAESWHGKFGHAKTRILSTNKDIMLEALTPTMEGQAVTVTDNHRHLGVVLSEDLKWSKHAQCILAAASKRAGLLRLMARDLPLPVASILYVYYVRPVLEYASPVWHGSLREEDAMSLERIQASVARSLLQADWFTPKEELFRQLGWPALRWRREITSLTISWCARSKKCVRILQSGCHDFFPPNSRSNVEFSRAFCRIFVDFRKVSSNKEQRPLLLASIFGKVGV